MSRAATDVTPIATNTVFAEEEKKLAKWREERGVMESEVLGHESRLHRMMAGEEVDEIAAALVNGTEAPSETQASLAAKIGELRTRIAAYRKADVLQLQRIRDVRAELSVDAAEALLPAYRKAVATMLKAVSAVDAAVAEVKRIGRALPEAGYDQRLPELAPPTIRPGVGLDREPWAVRALNFVEEKSK
jgi:hypothetical protein